MLIVMSARSTSAGSTYFSLKQAGFVTVACSGSDPGSICLQSRSVLSWVQAMFCSGVLQQGHLACSHMVGGCLGIAD